MSDKKPQAGEFWEWAGCRLRIIGTRLNGAVVAEHECGSLEFGCTAGDMKHISDCDSFDWQPEPVESPDDWVTQDRVPDRPGIDQWTRTWNGTQQCWEASLSNEERYMHGHDCADTGSVFQVRCRRRDLPPMPQEQPKREYVRLWFPQPSGPIRVTQGETLAGQIWAELKHDGTGFYLEDGK